MDAVPEKQRGYPRAQRRMAGSLLLSLFPPSVGTRSVSCRGSGSAGRLGPCREDAFEGREEGMPCAGSEGAHLSLRAAVPNLCGAGDQGSDENLTAEEPRWS